MLFLVEENKSLNPVAVSLFSAQAEMPEASNLADLVEQFSLGMSTHNTAMAGIMIRADIAQLEKVLDTKESRLSNY